MEEDVKKKRNENLFIYPLPLDKKDDADIIAYINGINKFQKAERVRFAMRLLMAYENGQAYKLLLIPSDEVIPASKNEKADPVSKGNKIIPDDIEL